MGGRIGGPCQRRGGWEMRMAMREKGVEGGTNGEREERGAERQRRKGMRMRNDRNMVREIGGPGIWQWLGFLRGMKEEPRRMRERGVDGGFEGRDRETERNRYTPPLHVSLSFFDTCPCM